MSAQFDALERERQALKPVLCSLYLATKAAAELAAHDELSVHAGWVIGRLAAAIEAVTHAMIEAEQIARQGGSNPPFQGSFSGQGLVKPDGAE